MEWRGVAWGKEWGMWDERFEGFEGSWMTCVGQEKGGVCVELPGLWSASA